MNKHEERLEIGNGLFAANESDYDDSIKERVTTNRRGKRLLAAIDFLHPEDVEYLIGLALAWVKMPDYGNRRPK